MSDNMPSKGDRPNPRSLGDLEDDLGPVSEADEIIQTSLRMRKWVRKELGKLKLDREMNIEDLIDEAVREYIDRHK